MSLTHCMLLPIWSWCLWKLCSNQPSSQCSAAQFSAETCRKSCLVSGKVEDTESIKNAISSSTLQMYFSQSYIFTYICTINKKHMSHHGAFLQRRYSKEIQAKEKSHQCGNLLKAKLKCLLWSCSLGCEGLCRCGSCWRNSAAFVILQHNSYRFEEMLLCYPMRQKPWFNLHSGSVGTLGEKK